MFGFNNNRDTIRTLEQARDDAQRTSRQWSERLAKLERAYKLAQSDLLRVEAERDALSHSADTVRVKYRSVMFDIMSQETPSANATVKRMARMAREALGTWRGV
jgi:Spy/CpxP family protein refolding chaperone